MSEKIDFEFMKNAAFPKGEDGSKILDNMNESHYNLTKWGFEHVNFGNRILDIGCGGGAAIEQISKLYPQSTIYGCDISHVSIESTIAKNKKLIDEGRLKVEVCGVSKLNFPDESFDSVYSIKIGGKFMTALEMVGGKMNEKSSAIAEHLNMKCPSKDELKTLLENAGFTDIALDYNEENAWLCAVATRK